MHQNYPKNNFQVGPNAIFELARPKVVSDICMSDQKFCRIEFSDHSCFRSSLISSFEGSLRALMHTNACALKSWFGRISFQPETSNMKLRSSKTCSESVRRPFSDGTHCNPKSFESPLALSLGVCHQLVQLQGYQRGCAPYHPPLLG